MRVMAAPARATLRWAAWASPPGTGAEPSSPQPAIPMGLKTT
jgi:hypothetical protein